MNKTIANLQAKLGVTADGVLGKKTLKAFGEHYKLSDAHVAHFFGQCHHESGGFTTFTENLNYSKAGLLKTFKKYFPTAELAAQYANKPDAIAARVYANRYGNGVERSGDGWKFRGRGAIQLTFRDNYKAFAEFIKDGEVLTNPDIVLEKYAFDSAVFYFTKRGIWSLASQGVNDKTIEAVSKAVNGGTNGLEDRKIQTKKYMDLLTK